MAAANPAGPLVGIRVLELSVAIAGPATAGLLSDWGATVTRIEFGKGDYKRTTRSTNVINWSCSHERERGASVRVETLRPIRSS